MIAIRPGASLLIGVLCIALVSTATVHAQPWKSTTLKYIEQKLAKPDGGYGWEDQPDSHLTPTFAVIGILNDLGKLPAAPGHLIEFVRTHHPQRGKNKEAGPSGTEERDLVYQQIQSLAWLQGDLTGFNKEVLGWQPQFNKVSNFEDHGYPVFLQEMMTPVCRDLLKISLDDVSVHFLGYLQARRRQNGSYNNAPTNDGGDGNIINTYWGLLGSRLLVKKPGVEENLVKWIRQCQLSNGGFTHQPSPVIGGSDDVAYTWAALKALHLLSAEPKDKKACIRYLLSLRNDDGGFGNKPGLPSNPMATYYAVDALHTLDAFPDLDTARFASSPKRKAPDLTGLKVFSVQFEASGSGSPAEAVMLADSLHINLWGTKNSSKAWRAAAQKIAGEKDVPVIFFQADEAYGKTVTVEGLGTFSHIMDYIAPASAGSVMDLDGSSWHSYQRSFIDPLLKENGALVLQVTNNEPLGRMILDESLKKGGYAAISTIHFGQNFSFWLPWLFQYRYQLPFIALQDAHGTESWWWGDELAGYRTLILARDGSYESMMGALRKNLVVAVRHDSISDFKTRMLGGAEGVQAFIRAREKEWQWWSDGGRELNRPFAAITVITPADSFEVARPSAGVSIRIRCQWSGVRQSLKAPLVELNGLRVDNVDVQTKYVEVKDKTGGITDSYYLYAVNAPAPGRHIIEASFRDLRNNSTRKMHMEFKY